MTRLPPTQQPSDEAVRWFQDQLADWFIENRREFPWRHTSSSYAIIIAEVLLQRTTAKAVSDFLPGFLARYPDWRTLASTRIGELEDALQPLGLWRRRAASLRRLAAAMIGSAGELPAYAGIAMLPGVGQYIANAVALAVRNEKRPLLDSNMARVLERFFGPRQLADIRYDPYLQTLAHTVVDVPEPRDLNWAVLDFAALVCRARAPKCSACPLQQKCRSSSALQPSPSLAPTISPRSSARSSPQDLPAVSRALGS